MSEKLADEIMAAAEGEGVMPSGRRKHAQDGRIQQGVCPLCEIIVDIW
jgi:hypothetical protein